MSHRFVTLDVFTDTAFGGNPLAVFPDGDGLSGRQMQSIARELNLSETVFVLPAEAPDEVARLRIFTPAAELPFAGHPTVGTAHALAQLGVVQLGSDETTIILREGVGRVPVRIRSAGGLPVACQLTAAMTPEFSAAPSAEALSEVLGVSAAAIRSDALAPVVCSCGIGFVFVALSGIDEVRACSVQAAAWDRHMGAGELAGLFVYAFGGDLPGSDLHGRMFAPALGVPEDPATGSAAVALAGVLARAGLAGEGTTRWQVEQGVEMGRPSILAIEATVRDGGIEATRVGGPSVMVSEGRFLVP